MRHQIFFQKGPYSFYDTNIIKELLTDAGFKGVSIEQVKKVIEYKTREEYLSGFIDGTPLSAFFQKKDASVREVMKQKLSEALQKEFGDSPTSEMLAYVCTGIKE